jgi:NitT/TauT family transport system substrate-binding protein
MRRATRVAAGIVALTLASAVSAACGGAEAGSARKDAATTLRLGYFGNVTHAVPLAGVEKGLFATALGDDVKLETQTFNAGPAAIEALFAGAIDMTYIGPNPAINAYAKSKGDAIRIIAGASSGGASLVVQTGKGITKAADL